jgi:hypothetical protein
MKQYHTIPFIWMTDQSERHITAEIDAVYKSGSTAFCIESRVHSDFCGDAWWRLLDTVMLAAKARNMKVWVLDDKSYPTGQANGTVAADADLRQWHIKCDNIDIQGPLCRGKILVNSIPDKENEDSVIGAFLLKRTKTGYSDITDISNGLNGDFITVSALPGDYRVAVIKKTRGACEYDRKNRIDMLQEKSVDCLIKAVYEPHYNRYGSNTAYGTTFGGFFSDEPRFGNGHAFSDMVTTDAYHAGLGQPGMAYPWSDKVARLLAAATPDYRHADLLSLWYDLSDQCAAFRCAYMDIITAMYAENFSGRLSAWCHGRGLLYCSHIIEDMGAHTRTGCSCGHYFRSQAGADFSGIDVVLHQIKPYFNDYPHIAPIAGGYADPLFFNNTLAKLCSSAAHIDNAKKGKALCEIFGAYGWAEGSKEMLYLANHMLVRGINHFIPHAFSSIVGNADCPPHFYERGLNPMFEGYGEIVRYMNIVGELLSDGKEVVNVAVLYHAEAEWSGKPFMPVDNVARELLENQLDFDIVPGDALLCGAEVQDTQVTVGQSSYKCLIVPFCAYLPPKLVDRINELGKAIHVLVVGDDTHLLNRNTQTIALGEIAARLQALGLFDIRTAHPQRYLRALHYRKEGKEYYFFHNEGTTELQDEIAVPFSGNYTVTDEIAHVEKTFAVTDGRIKLGLKPGRGLLYRMQSEKAVTAADTKTKAVEIREWTVFAKSYTESEYAPIQPGDITDAFADNPDFSGWVKLVAKCDISCGDRLQIDFGGEVCKITVGGKTHIRVTSPAIIERMDLPKNAEELTIELCNTLANAKKDPLSKFSVLNPVGISRVVLWK